MTNEEKKSNEIAAEYLMGHDRLEVTYEEMREAVMTMAEWKDQQYKKEFNVPDYCKTFEDIVYYIGHDIYAQGYNEAKSYDKKWLKEYLEKKRADIKIELRKNISDVVYHSFSRVELALIDEIINELFKEEQIDNSEKEE